MPSRKRAIFADHDFGFLIIRGEDLWGREDVGVGEVQEQLHEGSDIDCVEDRNRAPRCPTGCKATDGLSDRCKIFRRPIEPAEEAEGSFLECPQNLGGIGADLSEPIDLHFKNDRLDEHLFASSVQIANH